MLNLNNLNNLGALGVKGGSVLFDPSQIKVDGEKILTQQLLTKQAPTIAGTIYDESKNTGDARPVQLGRAYQFNGTNQEVTCGNIGTVTRYVGYVRFVVDNQNIWTLTGSTTTRIHVTGGTLTAGASLTLTSIKVDGVTKTAGEAGALLNDNLWHLLDIEFDPISATALALGRGDGAGNFGNIELFGQEFYNGATRVRFYKLDENTGSTAFNSIGGTNNGTILNAPTRVTQNIISYQNDLGYTLNGSLLVPRDESNITQDVQGNPLQFKGKVPYNATLEQSNCVLLDGVNDYIAVSMGTINNQRFSFFTNIENITTNGTIAGIYDTTGNGRLWQIYTSGGTISNSSINFRYGSTIGAFAGQFTVDGTYDLTTIKSFGISIDTITNSVKVYLNGVSLPISASYTLQTFRTITQPIVIGARANSYPAVTENLGAKIFNARLYKAEVLTGAQFLALHNQENISSVANFNLPASEGSGTILYDKAETNNGSLVNGPTWSTQNSFHNNIVNGFELYDDDATGLIKRRIPYKNDGTKITPTISGYTKVSDNDAGAYHNGAETLIDFTGNVLSPEAVKNSWETAWAFNTARTNPEFKRNILGDEDEYVKADRFLAYKEELTGTNLDKVWKYVQASFGTALRFDGVDDLVTVAPIFSSVPSELTISFWAKLDTLGRSHNFVFRVLGEGSNRSPRININSSNSFIFSSRYVTTNYDISFSGNGIIEKDKWFFVTQTMKEGFHKAYINGVLRGENNGGSGAFAFGASNMLIGRDDNVNHWLLGSMDEVKVFPSYFEADEVMNLYKSNVEKYKQLELLFNEASGTTAIDSSGNGNDGTITGATYTKNVPF